MKNHFFACDRNSEVAQTTGADFVLGCHLSSSASCRVLAAAIDECARSETGQMVHAFPCHPSYRTVPYPAGPLSLRARGNGSLDQKYGRNSFRISSLRARHVSCKPLSVYIPFSNLLFRVLSYRKYEIASCMVS